MLDASIEPEGGLEVEGARVDEEEDGDAAPQRKRVRKGVIDSDSE